jgi:hypothetical protein
MVGGKPLQANSKAMETMTKKPRSTSQDNQAA